MHAKTIHPARPKRGVFQSWAGWFKRRRHSHAVSLVRRLMAGLVVDPETGCHIWKGSMKEDKYGNLQISTHRLAWELANGPIPEGLHVLHRCDERRCCNPDHLFLGNQAENMADMLCKGRARNGYTVEAKAPRQRSRATRRRTGRTSSLDQPPAKASAGGPSVPRKPPGR